MSWIARTLSGLLIGTLLVTSVAHMAFLFIDTMGGTVNILYRQDALVTGFGLITDDQQCEN